VLRRERGWGGMSVEPTGTIEVALEHTSRLLQSRPDLALEQAAEILKIAPNHPVATLLLGMAQRTSGDLDSALKTLKALTDAQHKWAIAFHELGLTLGESGDHGAAAGALRRCVALKPDMPDAWRSLGDELTMSGDAQGADSAYANQIKTSTQDPRLMAAAAALCENQIPRAEALLREHLKLFPTDVAAIRMFAEVAARLGRYHDAENLLTRCLELAPSFNAARHNYAIVLHRLNKPAAALQQVEQLCKLEPRNASFRNLKAVILTKVGDYQESLELFEGVLKFHPNQAKIWMSYGHALSTAGRERDSIEAYRRCIAVAPSCGEAYWSLANLKTFKFSSAEIDAMRAQLARGDLGDEDRFHFQFALAKALEDDRQFEASFEMYAHANELRSKHISYSAEQMTDLVQRMKSLFTAEFFQSRAGFGAAAPDPIFIVGLPRAGSTLVEQILASHSAVEGTMELPDIIAMAGKLRPRDGASDQARYPEILGELSGQRCRALGEQYIEDTRVQRKTDKPLFIDKMPNNFLHIGLIRLILPNAKIIDARRHPMACCFSGFKQHFARGQNYTYSLEDIGRYYRDYVDLMGHFDRVLPGAVHRVIYERLIEDTDNEIRRLLEHCGLPFEEGCLKFYENDRAVRTASANQVRRPIFREGVEHWRNFERWLDPLKSALGEVLESYPQTPNV
jgi:predicted Zn-dependent protease